MNICTKSKVIIIFLCMYLYDINFLKARDKDNQ